MGIFGKSDLERRIEQIEYGQKQDHFPILKRHKISVFRADAFYPYIDAVQASFVESLLAKIEEKYKIKIDIGENE